MMNLAIIHGRLVKDPESRYTQTGKCVTSFSLAVPRRTKSEDPKKDVDYINCVAWDKVGEFVGNYCTKGKELLVTGRIQTRSYEANDGSKRYVTEIIISTVEPCGSRKDENSNNSGQYLDTSVLQNSSLQNESTGQFQNRDSMDEDIPF